MGLLKLFKSESNVCLYFSLSILSSVANAEEVSRQLESVRYLSRGNTYVAATDSDESTRGNVASMAESNVKFQIRWLQFDFMVGKNTMDTVQEAMELSSGSETTPVQMLQTFTDKFGKRQYGRGQLSPLAFRIGNFEMSPFSSSYAFVDMRVPTTPEVEFRSETGAGVNLSYAMRFGTSWSLGMTLRPVHKTIYAGSVAFADLLDFVDSSDKSLDDVFSKREGLQVGLDLGGIWTPSKVWRFGVNVENIGYAGNYGDFSSPPNATAQKVNLGTQYRMDLKAWHWDFLADIHDLLNSEKVESFRHLHLGTELGRSYISRDHDVGVLLGLNEGYLTSGAFIDLWIARLTASYYAVELGEYAGQRPDRRYGLSLLASTTF